MRGILIFYVNVGQMPFDKSDVLVKKMKKKFKRVFKRFKEDDYSVVYIPVREGLTRLEVLHMPYVER